jgi:hypothetical protein
VNDAWWQLGAWLQKRFHSHLAYWPSVLTLGVISIVPSFVLFWLAQAIVRLFGSDPAAFGRVLTFPNWWVAVVMLVFGGPLIETVLLALGLRVLGLLGLSISAMSCISALGWGLLHAITTPLQFFSVAWSFYVYSRGYLAWRPKGQQQAIGAAWIPHVMYNALAFGPALLLST